MKKEYLLTAVLLLLAASVQAQSLTWDVGSHGTNTTGTVITGSGTWNTNSSFWNNGSGDTVWVQTSTTAASTNTAIFGGADGNYAISNAIQIAAPNIIINNSGYTFSGSPIDLSSGGLLAVAAGKTATFNCAWASGNNSEYYWGNNGAVLNFAGNFGGQQPHFAGSSGSAFYLSGTNTPTVLWINAPVTQTNGSLTVNPSFFIGYPTTVNGTNYTTGILTVSGNATVTQNGGMNVGRAGGTGTLTLLGGTVNLGITGTTTPYTLQMASDDNGAEHGTVNVYGGALNLGSITQSSLLALSQNGSAAGETAILNQTNGIINSWGGIEIGGSGTYSGGSAMVTNSGGSLYLGPNGIFLGGSHPPTYGVTFSGGTIGALANWSSALPITLNTNNGSITFQCSDASGNSHDITLSGPIAGAGGLNVAGSGTLTLSGTNSYAGLTSITQGALTLIATNGDEGDYYVATNSTLEILAAAGSQPMSSLTLSAGATLTFNAGLSGNPTAPLINVNGALTPSSTVTINVAGSLTSGSFPLLKYGTMGGGGFNAFVLGSVSLPAGTSGSASLVNDPLNNSIDLDLTTYPSTRLAWAGTVNGNWDIGITPNWQTNADYVETVSGGPTVIFDDTAAGPYTAIILSTNVAPSGVIVNNTALTYSIGGAGGIDGAGGLTKTGNGLFTLGGHNTYSGGTTITSGTLALTTTNNAAMAYTNTGGTLIVSAASLNDSLLATALTFGNNNPQLIFNPAGFYGLTSSLINDSGNLSMNGNVTVNVTNALPGTSVLLQYAGTRSGTGSFIAGTLPPGATLTDNPTAKTVTLSFAPQPQVFNPVYNTNETVVSVVTPQQFGAKGDGITDDSAAFQNAMNWVYNQGNWGGGVIYVPPANYAFYTNIVVPEGVTLHGDWADWTTGPNGLVGTTFKVYFGAGQTNGAPFIFMNGISSLKDINIWYPNQNPTNIVGYPFSIQISGNCVLNNIVLVNSYQGILGNANSYSPIHILSTIIGSPLYMGISLDMLPDISETEDIRFSPNVWPASLLTNAPVAGGSYATWMRANGEGMRLLRVDGELSMDTLISGYNVGIEANSSTNGTVGATFYGGMVTNCNIALLAQVMASQSGLQFTDFTLDGDMAVDRTAATNDATVSFDHCQLIGRNGMAVYTTGDSWLSWMSFQNCTISNTMQLAGPGVFNVVDSSLTGSTDCVMSANATRVAFTGCTFSPATNIINQGNAKNLLMDPRQSISNALPIVHWTNVLNNYVARQPAKTNLYVVTQAPWGAYGNGVNDDTLAIQSALNAAGGNGGGIVYLPGGKYHLTNTLVVPSGVELRGVREMRGGNGYWSDGKSKASVLEPYEGQGTTNGPVALALSANSGVVGVNFNYETQTASCIPFPATIQGQGPNVYVIGVVCPNPYYYVDFDTYTCSNHLIYMVDGWILNTGFKVGNGSSGSIVDCQENESYWVVNNDSSYQFGGNDEGIANAYVAANSQMNILGNCNELMIKSFNINENTYLHCIAENGHGPVLNDIGTCCDGTIQGYLLDSAAASTINVVNSTMAIFSIIAPLMTNDTVGVMSTTNFEGTARFFNSALFGGPEWDFVVNGGDVGFDQVHMLDHAFNGSSVSNGTLHLINNGAYITYNGDNDFPPYNVTFGANAGLLGIVSELIGNYAYNGSTYKNLNTNNQVNVWQDYALSSYSDLSSTNQFNGSLPSSLELLGQLDSASQNLILQWPAYTGAYQLFSTPTLTPPMTWTPVTNAPVYSEGQWEMDLPLNNGGSEFYRLGPQN